MDLNATLLGQMITFALFVWFTMKFVWPPITKAMGDRQKQIADGLQAAEEGRKELATAQEKIKQQMHQVKSDAAEIIAEATHRAQLLIEEARTKAREEGNRLLEKAKADISLETQKAREVLRKQVTELALMSAERILQQKITLAENDTLLDKLISEL